MRRWGAEEAGPAPSEESEEAGQQAGGRRAGVKPAASGRACRGGWGRGQRRRPTGRDPLAGEGGREAGPARGWNYNPVEVRGAGPETIYSSPTSGADSPPITPSNHPQLNPSQLVT